MFSRPSLFALAAASTIGAFVLFTPATAHAVVLTSCGNIDLDGSESCTLVTSGGCTDAMHGAELSTPVLGGPRGELQRRVHRQHPGELQHQLRVELQRRLYRQPGLRSAARARARPTATRTARGSARRTRTRPSARHRASRPAAGNARGAARARRRRPRATCSVRRAARAAARRRRTSAARCNARRAATRTARRTTRAAARRSARRPRGRSSATGSTSTSPTCRQCLSELASALNINVSATGECANGTCSGQASASCGQIAPGAMPPMTESVLGIALGVGILGAARRRSRKSK